MSELLTHTDDLRPMEHYIPITSVNDINSAGVKFLRDQDNRDLIAKQGYEYVKERFDSVKCWNELIKEVDGQ